MTGHEYELAIEQVDSAFTAVVAVVTALDDAGARAPSRLPGWTRAHVVTHLARNADGNANIVEGALIGEEREQYPGGARQRADEIESGADRDTAALVDDLQRSQERLMSAWRSLSADGWDRTGVWLTAGRRPISAGLGARRRELLVHLVDLDLGVSPDALPNDFLEEQRDWLVENRTATTWPDAPWA